MACVLASASGSGAMIGRLKLGHFGRHDPSTGETTVIAPSEDPTLAEAVSAKCLPSVAAITVYADASQKRDERWLPVRRPERRFR
ncbi:MAG: hypothetical protein ACLTMP_14395 [Eggerthella lenta]